jgi:integrase
LPRLGSISSVRLVRDPSAHSQDYWHLFDGAGRSVWHFLDFIIFSVDVAQLSPKSVEGRAYAIYKYYEYLELKSLDFWRTDDQTLKSYRDVRANTQSKNSSGDHRARLRSVNLELRSLYLFFAWLQKDPHYGKGRTLIGTHGFQIRSTLLLEQTVAKRHRRLRGADRYPLCFRNAGEGSKHRLAFVPSNRHRSILASYFYSRLDEATARRNCLIFELAWTIGWRRGSIMSLTVDDFDKAAEAGSDELWIKPRQQKFGYSNSFMVPHRMAVQVLDYIASTRGLFVREGVDDESALFLSSTTGRPLTPHTASGIFCKARRDLGWPRGSGLHAWRRGFTNEFIEREIDARLELGLDTGGDSIALSLASALGHENVSSQSAYIRDSQRRISSSRSFAAAEEISRLHTENAELRLELERLRKRPD